MKADWTTVQSRAVSATAAGLGLDAASLLSPAARERCVQRLTADKSLDKITALKNRLSSSSGGATPSSRTAAVLVPLCVSADGHVSLLYTRRSALLSSHAGEVSFPGGVSDLSDLDHVDTAVRETTEELGITQEQIRIWGTLPSVPDKRGTTHVTPVIGEITTRPFSLASLQLNEQEVTEAFAVPLDQLIAPDACRYTQFRNGFSLPVFDVTPHRIWGLTAVITFQFLRVFLPKHNYKHTLRYQSPIGSS